MSTEDEEYDAHLKNEHSGKVTFSFDTSPELAARAQEFRIGVRLRCLELAAGNGFRSLRGAVAARDDDDNAQVDRAVAIAQRLETYVLGANDKETHVH